jgi:penicillin amidase
VESALPPGENGYWSLSGQARGELTKVPADFGPHTDDQRDLYWTFRTKSAAFTGEVGAEATQTPRADVRIHRGTDGVPSIYGDSGRAVWFGAGYAAATDRLFEADAVRRLGEGRLAELVGPSAVPADIAQRTVSYTDAEYAAILATVSPEGRDALEGYAQGVNARIAEVRADPALLPAEYALLSSVPEPWTVKDTLAAGVYITRNVASQGGLEMANVVRLKQLEGQYGKVAGRQVFEDLYWSEDPAAAVSVAGKVFSNEAPAQRSAAGRRAAFQAMADYADTIPAELARGVGTGNAPVPGVPGGLRTPAGTTALQGITGPGADLVRHAAESVVAWGARLHGGSFGFAISANKTRDGHPLLQASPQLDYSYPGELWELEVHGGGYDARGVSVPGIPTVGIGWNQHVAWALTTGYSKTIDSYIETTRIQAGVPQWLSAGTWRNQACRAEVVAYRNAAKGAPFGPAVRTQTYQVCRTGHGPVVAVSSDGSRSRSEDFAMWKREIGTVEGILAWNRAKDLADFQAGVAQVTWNENAVAADADGHIGYWHPGLYRRRAPGIDQRFPTPGDGGYDPTGYLSFAELPHVVDPPEGFVASWNNKPAHGWVDGDLSGTVSRSAGAANRIVDIQELIAARNDWTFSELQGLDARIGETDHTAQGYRPLWRRLRAQPGLTTAELAAVDLVLAWDGRAYAPGEGSSALGTPARAVTDGPAATLARAYTKAIKKELFAALPLAIRADRDTVATEQHAYDVTPLDNLALRVLRPESSGLTAARDWTDGRGVDAVLRAALDDAIAELTRTYGSAGTGAGAMSTWRRAHGVSHLTSLTDTVGPTGIVMPVQDRGSWVQRVGFLGPDLRTAMGSRPTRPARPKARPKRHPRSHPTGSLASTGWPAPMLAVALLVGAAALRRRRKA